MSGRWIVGLAVVAAAGCNLAESLGVTEDGSTGTTVTGGSGGTDAVDDTTSAGPTTAASESTGEPLPPGCGGGVVRVATFNVQYIGTAGSPEYEALVDIIARLDADLICLQEVGLSETSRLQALAADTGYDRHIQADEPPAIGGELTNACMSRSLLSLVGSYSSEDLSPDATANDVGRDILVVQADLSADGEPPCRVGLITLHLKSGQEELDWFRRQVEIERVVEAAHRYQADFPGEPLVILGDLNENLGDPALGTVFRSEPPGLPPSYQVGSDIVFPLTYDPFVRLMGEGFTIADATQEDSASAYDTWNDAVRLDYVMVSDAEIVEDEVYNSCRDDGVDEPPQGRSMSKAGEPLACGVSMEASDHFPIMVDLTLP